MELTSIVWLALMILMIIIEVASVNLVTLWFAIGSGVSLLASFLNASIWLQIVLFIVVSALCLIFVFPIAKNKLKVGQHKTNVDTLVGKEAVVTKKIAFNQIGQIDLKGAVWPSVSDTEIEVGTTVEIVSIEGNKLIVKKVER